MNVENALKLLSIYEKCPGCGSKVIGNGAGGTCIEENTFTRSCKCGFTITVDEDGKEVV